MDAVYGASQRSRICPQKAPMKQLFTTICNELARVFSFEVIKNVALRRYSLKQGLKMYGDLAVQVLLKEMRQLHDYKAISPHHITSLTAEERR